MSSEIRPFEIDVPQAELEDLHRRLAEARWPDDLVEDWSRGVPSAYLQELVRYWRDGYDWRTAEAELNEHSQFLTEVDGQTIHFLRIRSRHEDALPLLLLHGYPGSIVDFQQLIGPLTDGDGGDAFHLVIPSLPGYGFSTPLADRGWEAKRSARAMAALMGRLGYDRYGIHGFDIGAGVAGELGGIDSSHVLAVHVTTDPVALALLGFPLSKAPEGSSEGQELERLREYQTEGRLFAPAIDAAADACLLVDRLARRTAGVDRREVQGVDESGCRAAGAGRRSRPAPDQREHLLVHALRRLSSAVHLRGSPR
jgi:epoxide hydrolase